MEFLQTGAMSFSLWRRRRTDGFGDLVPTRLDIGELVALMCDKAMPQVRWNSREGVGIVHRIAPGISALCISVARICFRVKNFARSVRLTVG